jgi:5-(carboxyamino)imidazole ribonucleotide mutase
MEKAGEVLDRFEVGYDMQVRSAHRTPDEVEEYVRTAEQLGIKVLICAAGMAAHLAGAVAARTTLPVIGVPISAKHLGGADALYATVQMPKGVPVATVAIDGAQNAAILACQIIATADEKLRDRLRQFKQDLAEGLKL